MKLISVETTPNPNSMKLNFDQSVDKAVTYTAENAETAPEHVKQILAVDGVKSAFACANFVTANRDPRSDWKPILEALGRVFDAGKSEDTTDMQPSAKSASETAKPTPTLSVNEQRLAAEKSGRASVLVQTFRGIPIQVKVVDAHGEKRLGLSQRFTDAAQKVQAELGSNFLKERYWADWGLRYGSIEEVAAEILEEIEESLDLRAVEDLTKSALASTAPVKQEEAERSPESMLSDLENVSWGTRLRAVQSLSSTPENIPLLVKVLHDSNHQVRRSVAAALGGTGSVSVVSSLCDLVLNDSSVAVRRTAGDALSDLGFVDAEPAMCQALSDSNRLVRWRAARFLADVGTDYALEFLKKAENDEAFEVQLEVAAAIERISLAREGTLPMWKRLLDAGLPQN